MFLYCSNAQTKHKFVKTTGKICFLSKDVFFDILMYVFQIQFDYFTVDCDNNKQDLNKMNPKEKTIMST